MTKRKKSTPTFGEQIAQQILENYDITIISVSYTHLRAHETYS